MQKFIKQIQPVIDGNEERFIKKIVKTTFITENKFSKEFEGVTREKAESQTFWNEFFNIFGIIGMIIALR